MRGNAFSRRQYMGVAACMAVGQINQTARGQALLMTPNSLNASLVKISSEEPVGIGFIGAMDGNQYIFTNANVISGHIRLRFETLSGTELHPSRIELSATRDLARIQIASEDALKLSYKITDNEPIDVLEYHGSAVKRHPGTITGSSQDMIELSAAFDKKSCGSPVLDSKTNALGVATYLIYYKDNGGTWEGTPRSFAYKLDDAAWYSANWKAYNKTYGKNLRDVDEFRDILYTVAGGWVKNPKSTIDTEDSISLDFDRWVKSHNGMISDLSKKQSKGSRGDANDKIQKQFRENCDELIKICNSKADYLEFLCQDKKVTQYLNIQFRWRALELKKFCRFINDHAENHSRDRWM